MEVMVVSMMQRALKTIQLVQAVTISNRAIQTSPLYHKTMECLPQSVMMCSPMKLKATRHLRLAEKHQPTSICLSMEYLETVEEAMSLRETAVVAITTQVMLLA